METTMTEPRRRTSRWMPRIAPLAVLLLLPAASGLRAETPLAGVDRSSEWRGNADVYMVAIEGLVVEVNEDKTRDLGLHYGFNNNDGIGKVMQGADVLLGRPLTQVQVPTFTGNQQGITSTGFQPRLPGLGVTLAGMNVGGGVLSARLRALLDQGEARITTRPIVLARNGTSSSIHVGSTVPYQDVVVATGLPIVSEHEVGVNLELTPTIDLPKQTVKLDIKQVEVSSVSNFVTTQNVDRPVINKSDTRSNVTIPSGETYQLSSLKGRRTREIREGIPFLMDIPLLGHLFSSREEVHEGVDILFFVTPHIIPPGKNALLPYDFLHGNELAQQGVQQN